MKKELKLGAMLLFVFLNKAELLSAQNLPAIYLKLTEEADSLYEVKEYKKSASAYCKAFDNSNNNAKTVDRYNAACSFALAGEIENAFYQLLFIAESGNYTNYKHVISDSDLDNLHSDQRWDYFLELVKSALENKEKNYDKPLIAVLDSIYYYDQTYRKQLKIIREKYGQESNEEKKIWGLINICDSLNLLKTLKILDTYGWIGSDKIGSQGSITLFLVIQHADSKTQEKYIPLLRQAVKENKAAPRNLALMEDRLALAQGKKQIYGSQVYLDSKTGLYTLPDIEDEANVNNRRAEVGLDTIEEYLKKNFKMEYKPVQN